MENEFEHSQYGFNLNANLSLMYSSENYYIFFEIYSTNSQLSDVEIFFKNNFISNDDAIDIRNETDQIIYNVESEDDTDTKYQVNKTITIFNLDSKEKHAMRIRFFYVDSIFQ